MARDETLSSKLEAYFNALWIMLYAMLRALNFILEARVSYLRGSVERPNPELSESCGLCAPQTSPGRRRED